MSVCLSVCARQVPGEQVKHTRLIFSHFSGTNHTMFRHIIYFQFSMYTCIIYSKRKNFPPQKNYPDTRKTTQKLLQLEVTNGHFKPDLINVELNNAYFHRSPPQKCLKISLFQLCIKLIYCCLGSLHFIVSLIRLFRQGRGGWGGNGCLN